MSFSKYLCHLCTQTLPEHKGLFKDNICDDGMQAEVLAAKIVSMNFSFFVESAAFMTIVHIRIIGTNVL